MSEIVNSQNISVFSRRSLLTAFKNDSGAQAYRLLARHHESTYLNRWYHLLLPEANAVSSASYPDGYLSTLKALNGGVTLGELPPRQLPTGEDYLATLSELKKKGLSEAYHTAADFFQLASRSHVRHGSAVSYAPPSKASTRRSQPRFLTVENDPCDTTGDEICTMLEAAEGGAMAIGAPAMVLCKWGALAGIISLIIETDRLAALEAAELEAEADAACEVLTEATDIAAEGAIGWLITVCGCDK